MLTIPLEKFTYIIEKACEFDADGTPRRFGHHSHSSLNGVTPRKN